MENFELDSLGAQQRRVLEMIWEQDGATVQEVLDQLNSQSDAPDLAYTTVLTVMQKLEKAGWLTHTARAKRGRAYVYTPVVSRKEALGGTLRNLVSTLFGGDKLLMFQHFVDDAGLTDEELSEAREMIASRRKVFKKKK